MDSDDVGNLTKAELLALDLLIEQAKANNGVIEMGFISSIAGAFANIGNAISKGAGQLGSMGEGALAAMGAGAATGAGLVSAASKVGASVADAVTSAAVSAADGVTSAASAIASVAQIAAESGDVAAIGADVDIKKLQGPLLEMIQTLKDSQLLDAQFTLDELIAIREQCIQRADDSDTTT